VGVRLRVIRVQQGLSLQGVEEKSGGRWKTAAVGSYERGDRMLTAVQLAELAGFYGVPAGELLPRGPVPAAQPGRPRVVLDLPALAAAGPEAGLAVVLRYVGLVRQERGDWAGRVLTVGRRDLLALMAMVGVGSERELVAYLGAAGVLAGGGEGGGAP